MLFTYMYQFGLIIGLGIYALTFLFQKEMENKKKVLVIFIIGILFLFGSLTIFGGFEGMPYGLLSLGILTVSILLALFGNNIKGRRFVYLFIILFVAVYTSVVNLNKVDYWIVKKNHYQSIDDVNLYSQQLQKDPTIQGHNL